MLILQQDLLSDFKNPSRCNNICDGFRSASLDSTIVLDNLCIPNNYCNVIAESVSQGISSVVSDGSFCQESLIGPSGTSATIIAPAINCSQNLCATGTDKSYKGNKIIAGMNEDGVSDWKSCGNELAINFIIFDIYSMKYIDIYSIFLS